MIGIELEEATDVFVGVAEALILSEPRLAGFHVHVAVILGDTPEVVLPMHPEIRLPLALNVTREGVEMFAVIVSGLLKTGADEKVTELMAEVSSISMTVTVTVSYPILRAESKAFITTMYELLNPASDGISKFGAEVKLRAAEDSESLTKLNLLESSPPKMLIVEDSLAWTVAIVVEFSLIANVSEDVKVGGAVSTPSMDNS